MSGKYWTKSYNPITGCLPDFPCWDRCWARNMANRFGDPEFKPTFHPERLEKPLHWKKPQIIACCWMGDMFISLDAEQLCQIADIIYKCPQHKFLFLTKRLDQVLFPFYNNCFLGTSVSTQAEADERIPQLLDVDCKYKIISAEPLLGDIQFKPEWLSQLALIIVGGETGRGARPAKVEWFKRISDQCHDAGVPYYFKQWGIPLDNRIDHADHDWAIRMGITRREMPKEMKENEIFTAR